MTCKAAKYVGYNTYDSGNDRNDYEGTKWA